MRFYLWAYSNAHILYITTDVVSRETRDLTPINGVTVRMNGISTQFPDEMLIGQVATVPRVKQAESDQIVTAMQAKNILVTYVTYVLYPDEGHGFARPENRLSFYGIADAFLVGCQPYGGRMSVQMSVQMTGQMPTLYHPFRATLKTPCTGITHTGRGNRAASAHC